MDLIVDANILFAALVKDGLSAELLFVDSLNLFSPDFIFEEYEAHKEEILDKTHRTDEEFFHLTEILKRQITLIPLEQLSCFITEAESISPDPKDVPYIAAAMKLNAAIWSHDNHLKTQQRITVYSTQEIHTLVNKAHDKK
ncbi:MAG TPA: PIN domain-containing protein [Candidatus Nanoarchaeia archaeon]|nr:PIN domain-containing protein [Candidatus Nanoarchaeia archaeon]